MYLIVCLDTDNSFQIFFFLLSLNFLTAAGVCCVAKLECETKLAR